MLWAVVLNVLEKFVILHSSPVGDLPGRSGTGAVSTEVETDAPFSKRRAVVTRRLTSFAGDGVRPVCSSVPVIERSC